MESRALAIAFFYAIGTAVGGVTGPLIFAELVGTKQVGDTVLAFVIGAIVMIVAGLVEAWLGVRAERKGLEDVATPLSAEDATEPARAETPAAPATSVDVLLDGHD